MGADSFQYAVRAAAWVGHDLTQDDKHRLTEFHHWLSTEAIQAGGLGPHEHNRIWNRHVADSLLFCLALADGEDCLDIGSGVGLPGIPLAIIRPEIVFTLLDRSGRRCDLMRRAIAVLGLANCDVANVEVETLDQKFGSVVSRAAIPAEKLMIHVKRLLKPGGTAILGLTRAPMTSDLADRLSGISTSVVEVPPDILDTGVNLLRIGAT